MKQHISIILSATHIQVRQDLICWHRNLLPWVCRYAEIDNAAFCRTCVCRLEQTSCLNGGRRQAQKKSYTHVLSVSNVIQHFPLFDMRGLWTSIAVEHLNMHQRRRLHQPAIAAPLGSMGPLVISVYMRLFFYGASSVTKGLNNFFPHPCRFPRIGPKRAFERFCTSMLDFIHVALTSSNTPAEAPTGPGGPFCTSHPAVARPSCHLSGSS